MAIIPTRRHVLATTATAILAFMIVVPTVLHLVHPAFGQGSGPQGGYGAVPEPLQPVVTTIQKTVGQIVPGSGVTIDLRPPTPLEPASVSPLVTGALSNTASLKTDTKLVADLIADTSALKALVSDKAATEALLSTKENVDNLLASPAAIKTLASDPDAALALLANAEVKAKLADDAALFEEVATAILEQQHVSSIQLKSSVAGSNVQLTVKEFVPNSADQTAITGLGDADLAHITLKVAGKTNPGSAPVSGTTSTPSTATETLYTPLKILDITVAGVPHDSVGATIQFTVTQAELDIMGLAPGDITLLHQVGGAWVELPTTMLSHVGATYTFESETPSFSYFAVAGRMTPAGVTAEGMSALALTGIVVVVIAILVVVGVVLTRRRQG